MYLKGKSSVEISKITGISSNKICLILKQNNVKIRGRKTYIISDRVKKKIKKMYIDLDMNMSEIKKRLNVSSRFIEKALKELHIPIKDSGWGNKKYKVHREYFDCIDSENKAYFLGLIYADGSLKNTNLSITLVESDGYILHKFAKDIFFNDYNLNFIDMNSKNKNHQNQLKLNISDKLITDALKEKNGLFENKGLKIRFPLFIKNDKLLTHFVRGYFDGDGCISLSKNNTKAVVTFLGNKEFIEGLKNWLYSWNINSNIYAKKNEIFEIRISEKISINRFSDLMYKNSKVFLKRKRDKFLLYKKNQLKPSKHPHIIFENGRKKWRAYSKKNNKRIYIGRFDTLKEASKALSEYKERELFI